MSTNQANDSSSTDKQAPITGSMSFSLPYLSEAANEDERKARLKKLVLLGGGALAALSLIAVAIYFAVTSGNVIKTPTNSLHPPNKPPHPSQQPHPSADFAQIMQNFVAQPNVAGLQAAARSFPKWRFFVPVLVGIVVTVLAIVALVVGLIVYGRMAEEVEVINTEDPEKNVIGENDVVLKSDSITDNPLYLGLIIVGSIFAVGAIIGIIIYVRGRNAANEAVTDQPENPADLEIENPIDPKTGHPKVIAEGDETPKSVESSEEATEEEDAEEVQVAGDEIPEKEDALARETHTEFQPALDGQGLYRLFAKYFETLKNVKSLSKLGLSKETVAGKEFHRGDSNEQLAVFNARQLKFSDAMLVPIDFYNEPSSLSSVISWFNPVWMTLADIKGVTDQPRIDNLNAVAKDIDNFLKTL